MASKLVLENTDSGTALLLYDERTFGLIVAETYDKKPDEILLCEDLVLSVEETQELVEHLQSWLLTRQFKLPEVKGPYRVTRTVDGFPCIVRDNGDAVVYSWGVAKRNAITVVLRTKQLCEGTMKEHQFSWTPAGNWQEEQKA